MTWLPFASSRGERLHAWRDERTAPVCGARGKRGALRPIEHRCARCTRSLQAGAGSRSGARRTRPAKPKTDRQLRLRGMGGKG
jgi:hypothetical protein